MFCSVSHFNDNWVAVVKMTDEIDTISATYLYISVHVNCQFGLKVYLEIFPSQVLLDRKVPKETKEIHQRVSLHRTDLRAAETTEL